MTVTVLDTGVLYASIDTDDVHHATCARLLSRLPGHLLLPSSVLTETSWHVEKYLGTKKEAEFLKSVGDGELELSELTGADVARASELVATYADLRLGFVDASVIALAERLGIRQVATIDRRHFTAVRPCHVEAFTLLPEIL